MKALTYRYKCTVRVRKVTCGGMDSEYSHSEVREGSQTIVVPADDKRSRDMALAYVTSYNANWTDPAFELLGEPVVTPISAILHITQRLD